MGGEWPRGADAVQTRCRLVRALEEAEEEGGGEEDDRTAAREQAGDHLNAEERRVVIGHRRDQGELAAEEHDGAEGEQVGRDVEQVLGSAEELEVVGEGQQLLGFAEGAGRLELREETRVLGAREQASVRNRREQAQLLDALEQAHGRLGHRNLTALEEAILVEADDLRSSTCMPSTVRHVSRAGRAAQM